MFVACKPFVIVWAFGGAALFLIGSIFFVNYHRSRTDFFFHALYPILIFLTDVFVFNKSMLICQRQMNTQSKEFSKQQ